MVITFRMNFKTEKIQYLLWAPADSPEAPYCFLLKVKPFNLRPHPPPRLQALFQELSTFTDSSSCLWQFT